ncbi:YggS family pyridoxal phosphate-dependent enzyme [Fulvivirgaceae bacterium BMA10]|uniref:Pyridoxal phosphate homeostasis protein n=1 Tax=Splendidivirga corallicola TaxID=3051826 RepID=A0ABT8KXT4_9BACT|nr:YggS family pyridoxal phosphate-dependent enzyme [Fulvivirgaceae bacterium BMA10]
MSIKNNIKKFKEKLAGTNCKLIAVSKTKPVSAIMEAYDTGFKDFGENKVQEMVDKHSELPEDIHWHMIGHLQRNKVKYIAPFVHLIHSVDSFRLLKEINKQGEKNDRVIPCLLQMHIAEEETKFGLSKDELIDLINTEEFKNMNHIKIKGLMGMATNTDDLQLVQDEFKGLRTTFEDIKTNYQHHSIDMQEISMGMSGDYEIAITEGSTMVRVGSAIFGARNYN